MSKSYDCQTDLGVWGRGGQKGHEHGPIQDSPWEGAPTLQEGVPTFDLLKFSKKLHEIEKILGRSGVPLMNITWQK